MFTMKKLALISAAGLAALSISCSDTDNEPGGAFDPAFTLGLDADGYAEFKTGKIVANTGNTVESVKVTANDKNVTTAPALTSGGAEVTLEGATITGVCAAIAATSSVEVTIKVSVTFTEGDPIDDSKKITLNCGSTGSDPDLVKGLITLSATGTSYADLDLTPVGTYQQTAASSIKNKIDVIAYNGQTGTSEIADAIYPPYELDFFYEGDTYVGGSVAFYTLPSEAVTLISGASKLSQISAFWGALDTFIDSAQDPDEIPTLQGSGFLVYTTDKKYVAVIITATGASTVTLSTTKTE